MVSIVLREKLNFLFDLQTVERYSSRNANDNVVAWGSGKFEQSNLGDKQGARSVLRHRTEGNVVPGFCRTNGWSSW